jgi:hypothetical protein
MFFIDGSETGLSDVSLVNQRANYSNCYDINLRLTPERGHLSL